MSGSSLSALAKALLGFHPREDFTGRLPPAVGNADLSMVKQPPLDPGYAMPNASIGNLNQMPGQEVGGALPINSLLQFLAASQGGRT